MEDNIINREVLYEKGLSLVKYYVRLYSKKSYYKPLFKIITLDDAIQEVLLKFVKFSHLEKYDSRLSSFKYHIYFSVRRVLTELLRKHRHTHNSLDALVYNEDEKTDTFQYLLIDERKIQTYENKGMDIDIERLISGLPIIPIKKSVVTIKGVEDISYNSIVRFLLLGWTIKEIENYYSESLMKYIKIIRKYFMDFKMELQENV